MYRYDCDTILDEKNLTKIIDMFKADKLAHFQKLERYYNSKNDILKRTTGNDKPNNKLAHGFAKYITNMATGYFMGKGIRYEIQEAGYSDSFNKIIDKNYTQSINFELAKEASKKGVSYELLYIDHKAELRTMKLTADEVIPIYSRKIGEFLECAIRIWTESELDSTELTDYAEVYTASEIWSFRKLSTKPHYELLEVSAHNLGDIPIITYWNNEEQTGDYEDVLSLIDAYDKAQSDTANDFEYFTDAYLVIVGAGGGIDSGDYDSDEDEEERTSVSKLKQNRILQLDEKSQAYWLIKEINDTAQENYKDRIYNNMFLLSQVPALSDESFSGNLTGVAIKYKLIGLDELFVMKENKFLSAQKKKIKMLTEFINTKENKSYDAEMVEIKFERNVIENLKETIDNAARLVKFLFGCHHGISWQPPRTIELYPKAQDKVILQLHHFPA